MRPILLWIVTLLPLMSPVGALAQDNGDGMYTNPPLYADYPDPDIIFDPHTPHPEPLTNGGRWIPSPSNPPPQRASV